MKLKFLRLLPVIFLLLSACSENDNFGSNGYGKINVSISADGSVLKSSNISRAGETEAFKPEINQFSVKVAKKDGSYSHVWNTFADFDPDQQYVTGTYTLSAYYGAIDEEGFDKPYYYGESEFTVYDSEVSEPAVTATLANTMVAVNYTDAFKKYFVDYKTTIHSEGGAYIDFAKEETRTAYVRPGNISLELSLTKTTGTQTTFNPADIENALPKTLYSITFDVNGGEVGEGQLLISFDSTTESEPITIPLSEELFNAPAPTAKSIGYESGVSLNLMEGDAYTADLKANLTAISGLNEVVLTTASEYLISQGWPAEVNLLAATETQKATMTKF
ncbi:MAG: DUF4493 domain-containing protein [Muribaculaceae bacterium]|nr:DUF4493 domain-containing protein [Muribaculaceae bacterium]